MSAAIPVNCMGMRVKDEATMALGVPAPTKLTKPKTFPNGKVIPVGTYVDPYWRFVCPTGIVAADGSNPPYIGYRGGPMPSAGIIFSILVGRMTVQDDKDVHAYREALNDFVGDQSVADFWIAKANAKAVSQGYKPNSVDMTYFMADVGATTLTFWTRDEDNI